MTESQRLRDARELVAFAKARNVLRGAGKHHPSTNTPRKDRSDPFIEGVHIHAHLVRTSGATFKDAIKEKNEIRLCEYLWG